MSVAHAATPATVVLWTGLTVLTYAGFVRLQRAAGGAPLANPTLGTILAIAIVLRLTGTAPSLYEGATRPLALLLAPATVALGVPLAANLLAIRRDLVAILVAVVAGGVAMAASGALLVLRLGGGRDLALAMLVKAATTPIAMAVAGALGGPVPLAATFAIVGGLIVAVCLAPAMRLLRADPRGTGLSAGGAGSGIGAAAAARLGEREAAMAAMGVGLMGLATALLARPLARLFGLL